MTLPVSFIHDKTAFAICLSLTPFVAPPAVPVAALVEADVAFPVDVALPVLTPLLPLMDELAVGAAKPTCESREKRTKMGIGSRIVTGM